jgi:hypothetical protein
VFTGSRITRVYTLAANRGVSHVYIDGVLKAGLSDWAQTPRWQVARTWEVPYGTHTIEVRHSGAAGYIDLDALVVDISAVGNGLYDNQYATPCAYIGNWTHATGWADAYAQSLSWSNNAESAFKCTFSGDTVTYYFTKASNRGMAGIVIDGVNWGDLDLYSPTTIWQERKVYTDLGSGVHTLHVAVTGQPSGTYVDLDALRVGLSHTGTVCDDNTPAKYGCTYISHVEPLGGRRDITHRRFLGATDGGAVRWQMWITEDWEWNGSAWQRRESFPASQWYTNYFFDQYRVHTPQRTRVSDSAIKMRFRYEECTPTCYKWCLQYFVHYPSLGINQREGSAGAGCLQS